MWLLRILGRGGAEPRVTGIFQGSGSGGTYFRVRDVGDDSLRGSVPGGGSTQGSYMDYFKESPDDAG